MKNSIEEGISCLTKYWEFNSIPGLCTRDATAILPFSCENCKCLQGLLSVQGGYNSSEALWKVLEGLHIDYTITTGHVMCFSVLVPSLCINMIPEAILHV